jgi:hypothetical protein
VLQGACFFLLAVPFPCAHKGSSVAHVTASVDSWFRQLYYSAAEPLPHEWPSMCYKRTQLALSRQRCEFRVVALMACGARFQLDQPQEDSEEFRCPGGSQRKRRELAAAILDSIYLDDPVSQCTRRHPKLRRWLPPGRVADLYHVYYAAMVASKNTAACMLAT